MNKQNIEQIIRELFRENFHLYPELYPLTEDGLMTEEGTICAQEVAIGYYDNRAQFEIERDEKAGVTQIDYVEWVMAELSELIPAAPGSAKKAAQHYLSLYSDEKDSITKSSIREWWGMTEDQYEGVDYEEVEKEILSKL